MNVKSLTRVWLLVTPWTTLLNTKAGLNSLTLHLEESLFLLHVRRIVLLNITFLADKVFYVLLTLNMSFLVLLASIVSEKNSLIKHAVVPLYTTSIFLLPLSSGWQQCIKICLYLCILLEFHWDPWVCRLFSTKFENCSAIISSSIFSKCFPLFSFPKISLYVY